MTDSNITIAPTTDPPVHGIDRISTELKTVLEVWYAMVAVIGVCGNLLTITSILIHKKLKSIPNVYICNLAMCDLIVCGAVAPFNAYSMNHHVGNMAAGCTAMGALSIGLLGLTLVSLTAIAVNRYILIVKGGQLYSRVYTRRNVLISVVIIWVVPVCLILPGILGFGSYGYNIRFASCAFVAPDHMTYYMVQAILHGMCVGPCTVVTFFCYISIIIHFRKTQYRIKMSRMKANMTIAPATSPPNSKTNGQTEMNYSTEDGELSSSGPSNNNGSNPLSNPTPQARIARRQKASRRVVMNLCTVFLVFILCWTPVVAIYTIDYHNQAPASLTVIFYAIAISNSCLNVFIYAGMNNAFRKSYISILTCKCSKSTHF